MLNALAQGADEQPRKSAAESSQGRIAVRDRRLEACGFAAPRRRVRVVLDDLPGTGGVQQAVEASVQAGPSARVRWLLARQFDRRPRPRQRRPPVGVVQDAVDSRVEECAEVDGQVSELSSFGRVQHHTGQRQVPPTGRPGVQVQVPQPGPRHAIPRGDVRRIVGCLDDASHAVDTFRTSRMPCARSAARLGRSEAPSR